MLLRRYCLLGLVLPLIIFTQSYSQVVVSESPTATFQAKVRVVVVDVVVTTKEDEPITGLHKEDFQLFENGHPETLASFEEHSGIPDVPGLAIQAKLPPNTFSNTLIAKTGDAANVLLLDALNTQMEDQSYLHSQAIKYIKEIRPGTRLAVFTLGSRLRFVQGFTSDASLLAAALNGKKTLGNPQLSALLPTSAETDASQRLVAQMQEMNAANSSAQQQAAIEALQQFQSQTAVFETDVRVHTTLEAMQQLARYLEGIPGRKNVIWLSGSFPLTIFADFPRLYEEEVKKTANLLAAAQIAIYPIGAKGADVNRQYDFSGPQPPRIAGATPERQVIQYQSGDLQQESTDRNASNTSMDELAIDTGGEAIYNTNGLNEALSRVLNDGTHYYTLTYAPSNKAMDGRLRRIEVKLTNGKYRLAYRRGYYADGTQLAPEASAKSNGDPLRPLMDHGTPDSTEVLYKLHLEPSTPQPAAGAAPAGDNPKLKSPITRYSASFAVSPDHLSLEPGPDGVRHASLEVTLVGYDRDGTPLNWMVRELQFALPPERYAAVQASGLTFGLEIDVPASDAYLRSGVYDAESNKAGTLEIPLAAVVALAGAPK